jgi:hypothetical protein
MGMLTRELYSSPNGDRWLLAREPESGHVFVQHQPNLASGGKPSELEIGAFLLRGGQGPEHQALLRLIGSLVEPQTASWEGEGKMRDVGP